MTAGELHAIGAEAAEATALVQGTTEQVRLRALAFDFNAPLPDLHIQHHRSWEPAARHYRDLTEAEKQAQKDES